MGAEDVEVVGYVLEEESLCEVFHGEDVDEERVAAESLKRQRFEDALGGEDGGAEEDDVGVAFAEVVEIRGEEGDAEAGGGGGVIGSGVGEESVALGG